nr:GNAT family N-acetyltransferase [Paenibacillus sp. P32E]
MNRGMANDYCIAAMDEQQARKIVNWVYEPPYSIYNMTDDPEDIQEMLDGTYFSVLSTEGELVGFFCYGQNAQVPGGRLQGLYIGDDVLDIGLGMRPDLTGKGKGLGFVQAGLAFGQATYAPSGFRLTVAAFNQRAFTLYTQAGFVRTTSFLNKNGETEREFIIMESTGESRCMSDKIEK